MGKTAVITGASRGIGKAIAAEFSAAGYNVAVISRHYDEVKETADELASSQVFAYECDVSDKDAVVRMFENVMNEFGSIDILVNNAGVNSRRTLNTARPEAWFDDFNKNLDGWNEEISVNLTGVFICSYIAAGYMIKQGRGSIINIASIKGVEPTTSPGYGASKAGVLKLTKDFAKALAPYGIRVNCISPGFIDTGMTSELPPDKKDKYRAVIPMGRFGGVEEIAKTAAFLASNQSSYMTGATLDVNGGYLMR